MFSEFWKGKCKREAIKQPFYSKSRDDNSNTFLFLMLEEFDTLSVMFTFPVQ